MSNVLRPRIDPERCDGCGWCVQVCPTGALGLVAGKAALTQPDRCEYDGACEEVCPNDALALPYQVVWSSLEFEGPDVQRRANAAANGSSRSEEE